MIRDDLGSDPTLAGRLRDDEAPAVLAPHAAAVLSPREAAGLDLILEGFLAHHLTPLHLVDGTDRHVLAGDFCYASGLVRVAESGDVEVIGLLADLVARAAGLVAEARREVLVDLWAVVNRVVATRPREAAAAALRSALLALDAGDSAPLAALAAAAPQRADLAGVLA